MHLRERITNDMKAALKARQSERLAALRLLLAAMRQREIDERIEASDTDVISIIEKMLKQRRDSISQFEAAGRHDLADKEKFETAVLEEYLPQPLSDTEIAALIDRAVQSTQASSMKDMGKLMTALRPDLAGRVDMAKVSALIKARLGG